MRSIVLRPPENDPHRQARDAGARGFGAGDIEGRPPVKRDRSTPGGPHPIRCRRIGSEPSYIGVRSARPASAT